MSTNVKTNGLTALATSLPSRWLSFLHLAPFTLWFRWYFNITVFSMLVLINRENGEDVEDVKNYIILDKGNLTAELGTLDLQRMRVLTKLPI